MVSDGRILLFVVGISAFRVYCGPNSDFRLSPDVTYNISIDFIPDQSFFIIGQKDKNASMTFNSASRTLMKDFEIYSLSSYENQLPYLIFTPNSSKTDSYYFTVCSFEPLIIPPTFNEPTKIKEDENRCTVYNEEYQDDCTCLKGYVGTKCDLKYKKYHQYDKDKTTSKPFSLKYFKKSPKFDVNFTDYSWSTFIFYGKNKFPSFFEFDGFKVAKYSGDFEYFSVFCGSEIKCYFEIRDKNKSYKILIIILCSIFGPLICFICCFNRYRIINCIRKCLNCSEKPDKLQIGEINNLEMNLENKNEEIIKSEIINEKKNIFFDLNPADDKNRENIEKDNRRSLNQFDAGTSDEENLKISCEIHEDLEEKKNFK